MKNPVLEKAYKALENWKREVNIEGSSAWKKHKDYCSSFRHTMVNKQIQNYQEKLESLESIDDFIEYQDEASMNLIYQAIENLGMKVDSQLVNSDSSSWTSFYYYYKGFFFASVYGQGEVHIDVIKDNGTIPLQLPLF